MVEPVGEEGKSRLRQLEMRVSDKGVLEELRKEVRGSENSSEEARRDLLELKNSVWEDGVRVIAVLNGTIWRLADLIKDGKGERVSEPEQKIKNPIARWFRRDRHPELDFLTVQILSLPSANSFSTTAYLTKRTLNQLSMLDIHLHIIPTLLERLKFEVIFSIPGLKRKSRDALYDLETKIEPFDKFRREVSRRRSGLDGIEQTYRGAGASVAELQRQAGGGLLKIEGLDDRVRDGKLLGVFRGAVEELEGARRRWRKLNRKNQDLGEESKESKGTQKDGVRTFDRRRGRGFNLSKELSNSLDPYLKHLPIDVYSTLSVFFHGDSSAVESTNASSVLSSFARECYDRHIIVAFFRARRPS